MPTPPKPLVVRPRAPTTVNLANSPVRPESREYVHFTRVAITAAQISGAGGTVNAEQLVRVLNLVQGASEQSTYAVRCAPSVIAVTLQNVAMVNSNTNYAVLRHGLGYHFTGYDTVRTYANSQPWSVAEAPNNGGLDATQYLVLRSFANGTFDARIW